jgi:acylphosphatase
VQGIGFRYTARRLAGRFDVAGYVQNLPDGRVKLVAEGVPAELDRFLAAIRAALTENIDQEQTETTPATGEFPGFDIHF